MEVAGLIFEIMGLAEPFIKFGVGLYGIFKDVQVWAWSTWTTFMA